MQTYLSFKTTKESIFIELLHEPQKITSAAKILYFNRAILLLFSSEEEKIDFVNTKFNTLFQRIKRYYHSENITVYRDENKYYLLNAFYTKKVIHLALKQLLHDRFFVKDYIDGLNFNETLDYMLLEDFEKISGSIENADGSVIIHFDTSFSFLSQSIPVVVVETDKELDFNGI